MLLLALVIGAPLAGLPQNAKTASAFVPKGWSLETQSSGDLDADGIDDIVLVLLQTEAAAETDRARALVVLRATKEGFALLATNRGLAASFQCLGIKGGDATPELAIEKGVLVVSQFGGSREGYGSKHRFRLEKNGFRLIGVDHTNVDTLTGAEETKSENLLSGAVVEEKKADGDAAVKRKRSKVAPKPLPAFEDVKEYGE